MRGRRSSSSPSPSSSERGFSTTAFTSMRPFSVTASSSSSARPADRPATEEVALRPTHRHDSCYSTAAPPFVPAAAATGSSVATDRTATAAAAKLGSSPPHEKTAASYPLYDDPYKLLPASVHITTAAFASRPSTTPTAVVTQASAGLENVTSSCSSSICATNCCRGYIPSSTTTANYIAAPATQQQQLSSMAPSSVPTPLLTTSSPPRRRIKYTHYNSHQLAAGSSPSPSSSSTPFTSSASFSASAFSFSSFSPSASSSFCLSSSAASSTVPTTFAPDHYASLPSRPLYNMNDCVQSQCATCPPPSFSAYGPPLSQRSSRQLQQQKSLCASSPPKLLSQQYQQERDVKQDERKEDKKSKIIVWNIHNLDLMMVGNARSRSTSSSGTVSSLSRNEEDCCSKDVLSEKRRRIDQHTTSTNNNQQESDLTNDGDNEEQSWSDKNGSGVLPRFRIGIKGRVCANCKTTKTPEWRHRSDGATLCNACGLQFMRRRRKGENAKQRRLPSRSTRFSSHLLHSTNNHSPLPSSSNTTTSSTSSPSASSTNAPHGAVTIPLLH